MRYYLYLAAALFSCLPCGSQTVTLRDTVYFGSPGNRIRVIQVTNREYYNDSTCIWEVSYPVLSGTGSPAMEENFNLRFAGEVSFGDCTREKCDVETMDFPRLSRYWDKVTVTGMVDGVMSLRLSEGSCPINSKICMQKTRHIYYDLKSWSEKNISALFLQDERSHWLLDSAIQDKLEFVPDDPDVIRRERQIFFENGKVFVFYDVYTIEREQVRKVELPMEVVCFIADPAGPLGLFCNNKKKNK